MSDSNLHPAMQAALEPFMRYGDSDRRAQEPDNACPWCGALDCSPNVEAFEVFGDVMCDACAKTHFAGAAEAQAEAEAAWQAETALTGETADPRDPHPTRTGIFRNHNCWKCRNGELPCVSKTSLCEYPHARND